MRAVGPCESWKWLGTRRSSSNVMAQATSAEEEQQPLVQAAEEQLYKGEKEPDSKHGDALVSHDPEAVCGVPAGPIGEGVVMGEPVVQNRRPWSTGLLSCLPHSEEFCSSDIEVCVLGLVAPCVLYGSNMERIQPGRSTFASHCMAYSSLFMMGNFLFNGNFIAPAFSFGSRLALRRSQQLEGQGEALVKSVGCCSGLIDSEEKRERLDVVCDFAAHFLCHRCALCQEARELRRCTLHPSQTAHYYSLTAPSQQAME